MTPYQELEKDLLQCGWNVEAGRGDHMKFTKPGIQTIITIARNISDKGRDLQNTVAKIRKYEPDFWRTTKTGTSGTGKESPEENGLPSWMQPGEKVRWTKPEKRDFAKLDDPGSVMNIAYIVREVTPGNGDNAPTMLLVSPAGDPVHTFRVEPSEVDAWETAACSDCGKVLPVNLLAEELGGGFLCKDCAASLIKELDEEIQGDEPLAMAQNTSIRRLPSLGALDAILSKYDGDLDINAIPEEDLEKIKNAIISLPSKTRKEAIKFFPQFKDFLTVQEKKKLTPYEAWNIFKENYVFSKKLSSHAEETRLKSTLAKETTYSHHTLHYDGGKLHVIEITVADFKYVYDFWQMTNKLYVTFSKAYPEKEPLAIRIHCPKEGIRQYFMMPAGEHAREVIKSLKALSPEKEQDQFLRADADTALPSMFDTVESISKCIGLTTGSENNPNYVVQCSLALRESERTAEHFETAKPYFEFNLEYNSYAVSDKEFRDVVETIRNLDIEAPFSLVIEKFAKDNDTITSFHVFGDYFDRKENHAEAKSEDGSETGTQDEEEYGIGNGKTLLKIVDSGTGLDIITAETAGALREEEKGKYKEIMRFAFGCLLKEQFASIVHEAIKETFNEHKNNVITMNETNYLDSTNPASANAAAGALTTRELIRELKNRGLSFENLRITIVQDINTDEI